MPVFTGMTSLLDTPSLLRGRSLPEWVVCLQEFRILGEIGKPVKEYLGMRARPGTRINARRIGGYPPRGNHRQASPSVFLSRVVRSLLVILRLRKKY